MSTLHFAIIMFAFVLLLLFNIFFVYIPVYKIEQALLDIDSKVEEVSVVVEPIVTKLTPLLDSLL